MRREIVERLCVGAPAERAVRARALIPSQGNLADQLIALGFAPADVVDACAEVTGIAAAPTAWVKEPRPPPTVIGLDPLVCRRVQAAPVAAMGGRLCIAYADPEMAVQHGELGLPAHVPYLASSADLARALALLPEASLPSAQLAPTVTNPIASQFAPSPESSDDAPATVAVHAPPRARVAETLPDEDLAAPPTAPQRRRRLDELIIDVEDATAPVDDATSHLVAAPLAQAPPTQPTQPNPSPAAFTHAALSQAQVAQAPVAEAPIAQAPIARDTKVKAIGSPSSGPIKAAPAPAPPPRTPTPARADPPPRAAPPVSGSRAAVRAPLRAGNAPASDPPAPGFGWARALAALALVAGAGVVAAKWVTPPRSPLAQRLRTSAPAAGPALKQHALIEQSLALDDHARALALLTEAVALPATGEQQRDAYLERARRALALGQLDSAEGDLLLVARRADRAPIEAELAHSLDAVRRARALRPRAAPPEGP